MKKLFIIDDTLSNKITYYHLIFFLAFLPFDLFYSEVILVSLSVHTLIQVEKTNWKKLLSVDVLLAQGLFLLTLFSNLYATNKGIGFSLLARQLALFIFPILLAVSPLKLHQYKARILSLFAITCTLTILYLYIDAFRVMRYNHLPLTSVFTSFFINQNFSLPIGIHATYLSMYAALSLFYLLELLYKPGPLLKKTWILLSILILLAGLLQLASRSVLTATLVVSCLLFPLFFLQSKKRLWYISIAALLLSFIFWHISAADSLKSRYVTELKRDLTDENTTEAVTNSRRQRWKLGWQLVKGAPIIGYGSGDEVPLLREKYFENHLYSAYLFKLNAHNQYLSYLIKSGIIGLLFYLFILFYGFRTALNDKDFVFLSFLLLLFVVSFSENYLDVNKGIFFYAFFFSFFLAARKKAPQATGIRLSTGNPKQAAIVSTY